MMIIPPVACADTEISNSETTAAESQLNGTDSADETTAINAENILGIRDYSGETLTFFSRIASNSPWITDLMSEETVRPAYYDICHKGRYFDDAESGEMLDIITTGVSSDRAEIFYWGNFKPKVQDAIAAGQSITSITKSNAPSTGMAIKKSIEAFEKIP